MNELTLFIHGSNFSVQNWFSNQPCEQFFAYNANYITMFKTIVTNTKNRRNIKYLFKNNANKTPNAIDYHGGLSSTLEPI